MPILKVIVFNIGRKTLRKDKDIGIPVNYFLSLALKFSYSLSRYNPSNYEKLSKNKKQSIYFFNENLETFKNAQIQLSTALEGAKTYNQLHIFPIIYQLLLKGLFTLYESFPDDSFRVNYFCLLIGFIFGDTNLRNICYEILSTPSIYKKSLSEENFKNVLNLIETKKQIKNPSFPEGIQSKLILKEKISQGFSSIIFEAYYKDKPVVLKMLKDNKLKSFFQNEIEYFKKISDCEYIVTYFGKNSITCGPLNSFLILEKMGFDFFNIIQKYANPKDTFNLDHLQFYWIIKQVVLGLKYLHLNGIVHRDIKPENVLIIFEKDKIIAKITDFGYSSDKKPVERELGSVFYAAPEIIKKIPSDAKVDIYALGKIFFLLTTFNNHLNLKPANDMPKNITKELRNLIIKSTDDKPENRPDIDSIKNIIDQNPNLLKSIPRFK